ncbi:hypothetical protein V2J09_014965 [Rumex salicifolius]
MDSFSIYKGYGKVDHIDGEQQPFSHRYGRRRAVIIAASSLLLLTLILVCLIGVLHHESGDSDDDEFVDPIRYACKFTPHQDACFGAISSINSHPKPDPVSLLSILLRSTMNELGNELALPKRLMSKVKDHRTVVALEDCGSLLNDAVGSLNQSAIKLSEAEEYLTETAMGDLRTWISAAMTDQETCLDGLEEMEASVVEEMRKGVQGAKVGMSNSLAILANMDDLKKDMIKMCHQQPRH